MDLAQLTSDLERCGARATSAAAAAPDTAALEAIEIEVLGKKGELTAILRGIGRAAGRGPPEGRRGRQPGPRGRRGFAVRGPDAARGRGARRPGSPPRRPTSPRRAAPSAAGSLHPIVETAREIADVFAQFGFVVYEGPEIEDDVTNFQMLNIPPDHPGARPVGHALPRRRGQAAAHAHEPGPDPRHAAASGRRSGRCCRGGASGTKPWTPATRRSSSRSRA